jgi:hypothetical protein
MTKTELFFRLTSLTEQPVVEEPKPLVNVGQDPGVGVDVKAVDHLKQEIGLGNLGPYSLSFILFVTYEQAR